MIKFRNAEEQAFWDAVSLAIVGALVADDRVRNPVDSCCKMADKLLEQRRERMGAGDATP